ncbi:uncharacterized protein K02A2.6-like [Macrosteles quadrilineatus]|uniref:uncharacterized protein K02A2.6-like n=1 Tax=Macrosteles quadrilineatus TaxID=74068 RepID=UPI0023E1E8FD|nr:uncharacterized protein K02A2.6-like [Macrosteles quadrilineatus]
MLGDVGSGEQKDWKWQFAVKILTLVSSHGVIYHSTIAVKVIESGYRGGEGNECNQRGVHVLRKLFSTFGYPFTLVSDNGPNFTSSIFNKFLQACGVTHKFSAPYHPATNGQAERFVQTVKKQLIAMENDGGDLHFKINHILMSLRNATNATGSSAYELMFGRRIRTRLDLMKKPQDHTGMPDECTKIKREFRAGDRVQVRKRNFGKDGKWKFGNVRRREGLIHYQIEMDNGQVWRRHINHIRPCKFEGED